MSKPVVEIISPSKACNCSFSAWINNVWDIITKYKDSIEIESITSDTLRAKELGVASRAVIINGEITPVFLIAHKLKELI